MNAKSQAGRCAREPLFAAAERLRSGAGAAPSSSWACLARIDDPAGEGARAFLRVARETARASAAAVDRMRDAGVPLPPLAGVPISVKDLFDVAGEPTLAGSRVLDGRPAAQRDAPAVARLRAAGAVLVGRTNMTEFAYSGVGLNPHYGTPANPYDRAARRLPGGSSSGAVVSVTDGMALGAIGTDTGGSCRIPAALCGVTGFRPTQARVPLEGVVPLSTSYDSVGALAPRVGCVALLDAVMAGESPHALPEPPVADMRFLVVENVLLDDLDPPTAAAFDAALSRLSAAGAEIGRGRLEALRLLPALTDKGGLVAAEACAWHRDLIAKHSGRYDPRVLNRILLGAEQTAADYIRLLETRDALRRAADEALAGYDAVLAPTVPLTAPPIAELDDNAAFTRINRLMLRNPSLANMLDRPSISLPCHAPGEAPVGLMLTGEPGRDRRLLSVAAAVETCLAAGR